MEQINLQDLPPTLASILDTLKREGVLLGNGDGEVKSPHLFENKAIEAVNEALQEAAALYHCHGDYGTAVHLLEKIQVAAALAQKSAFLVMRHRALLCSQMAHRIADQSRGYFHELKDHRQKPIPS